MDMSRLAWLRVREWHSGDRIYRLCTDELPDVSMSIVVSASTRISDAPDAEPETTSVGQKSASEAPATLTCAESRASCRRSIDANPPCWACLRLTSVSAVVAKP